MVLVTQKYNNTVYTLCSILVIFSTEEDHHSVAEASGKRFEVSMSSVMAFCQYQASTGPFVSIKLVHNSQVSDTQSLYNYKMCPTIFRLVLKACMNNSFKYE